MLCSRTKEKSKIEKQTKYVTGERATRRRDDLSSYIVPRWSDAKADVSAGPRTEQPIGRRINRRVSVVRGSHTLQGNRVVYN